MQHSPNPLSDAFKSVRLALWGTGLLSLVLNLLMLTGPLFMLQVYDRVLTSQSVPTLAALFGLVGLLYVFFGLFDFFRSRVLSRIGYWLDCRLAQPSLNVWVAARLSNKSEIGRPTADLSTIRNFLNSQGLPALFDLPWAPMYLAIVFLLHAQLGWLALGGSTLVVVLAIANEISTRKAIGEAVLIENRENQFAEYSLRNAEAIFSMGVLANVARHWGSMRNSSMERAQAGGDIGAGYTSTSKALRMLIQSAMLGLGAYLAIQGQISPGTIVAASILAGRALAPIDQSIGNWRNIVQSRQAYDRLFTSLAGYVGLSTKTTLPEPNGNLEVNKLYKFTPISDPMQKEGRRPIIQGLQFSLKPGDALGVIGPSAAGKSTLARLLVGLQAPDQGSVRLDGATFDQWDPEVLGAYIGYLPQTVELLPGTLRQNIARFDPNATDDEVISAAQLAGAHDLIVGLADGYSTQVGFGMPPLSGGQVQRIALARAMFRKPKLIILDEPSSNLDAHGDAALSRAIMAMRKAGSILIVMTHRPSTLTAANLILMIKEGQQADFGEKTNVLQKVSQQVRVPTTTNRPPATSPAQASPQPEQRTVPVTADHGRPQPINI